MGDCVNVAVIRFQLFGDLGIVIQNLLQIRCILVDKLIEPDDRPVIIQLGIVSVDEHHIRQLVGSQHDIELLRFRTHSGMLEFRLDVGLFLPFLNCRNLTHVLQRNGDIRIQRRPNRDRGRTAICCLLSRIPIPVAITVPA
ncbi:hypothetical protein D3C73_543660 [compost metagenome]